MLSLVIDRLTVRTPRLSAWLFYVMLLVVYRMMIVRRWVSADFRKRLKGKCFTAQISTLGGEVGRSRSSSYSRSIAVSSGSLFFYRRTVPEKSGRRSAPDRP
jgi:hypothetical protein